MNGAYSASAVSLCVVWSVGINFGQNRLFLFPPKIPRSSHSTDGTEAASFQRDLQAVTTLRIHSDGGHNTLLESTIKLSTW